MLQSPIKQRQAKTRTQPSLLAKAKYLLDTLYPEKDAAQDQEIRQFRDTVLSQLSSLEGRALTEADEAELLRLIQELKTILANQSQTSQDSSLPQMIGIASGNYLGPGAIQYTEIHGDVNINPPVVKSEIDLSELQANCEYFQPRQALEALKTMVNASQEKIVKLAVTGLSGSGKTELVKRFALDYHNNLWYPMSRKRQKAIKCPIVWLLDALTPESLFVAWQELACYFGIVEKSKEETAEVYRKRLIKEVKLHLTKHPGWLLIFDDAQFIASLTDYLPTYADQQGIVLVTSQNGNFWGNSRQEVSLNSGLEPDEAIQLSHHIYSSYFPESKDDIDSSVPEKFSAITEILGRLPLALSITIHHYAMENQLRWNLNQDEWTTTDYINSFLLNTNERQREYLESKYQEIAERNQFFQKTQEYTVREAIKRTSQNYQLLLTYCALVNFKKLTIDLLLALAEVSGSVASGDKMEFSKGTINDLLYTKQNRSLLNALGKGQFSMHQVTANQILDLAVHHVQGKYYLNQVIVSISQIMMNNIKKFVRTNAKEQFINYFEHIQMLKHRCIAIGGKSIELLNSSGLCGIVAITDSKFEIELRMYADSIIMNNCLMEKNLFIFHGNIFLSNARIDGNVYIAGTASLSNCLIRSDLYFIGKISELELINCRVEGDVYITGISYFSSCRIRGDLYFTDPTGTLSLGHSIIDGNVYIAGVSSILDGRINGTLYDCDSDALGETDLLEDDTSNVNNLEAFEQAKKNFVTTITPDLTGWEETCSRPVSMQVFASDYYCYCSNLVSQQNMMRIGFMSCKRVYEPGPGTMFFGLSKSVKEQRKQIVYSFFLRNYPNDDKSVLSFVSNMIADYEFSEANAETRVNESGTKEEPIKVLADEYSSMVPDEAEVSSQKGTAHKNQNLTTKQGILRFNFFLSYRFFQLEAFTGKMQEAILPEINFSIVEVRNQVPDKPGTFYEIGIPLDETCWLYAAVLAALLPLLSNPKVFALAFKRWFGRDFNADVIEQNRLILFNYDGSLDFIKKKNATFESLINTTLRQRVADFLKENSQRKESFVRSDTFDKEVKDTGVAYKTGDQLQLEGLSHLVKRFIIVYQETGQGLEICSQHGHRAYLTQEPLRLVYLGDTVHYHYLIEPTYISQSHRLTPSLSREQAGLSSSSRLTSRKVADNLTLLPPGTTNALIANSVFKSLKVENMPTEVVELPSQPQVEQQSLQQGTILTDEYHV